MSLRNSKSQAEESQRESTRIRMAKKSDAAALLEIYAPSILAAATSFETELPSLEEMMARVEETLLKFPWLVWEQNGEVVGYAYASPHRSRCAYGWSVESSVYVSSLHRGKGIGRALYRELFDLLKAQGVVNVLAGITLPNDSSVGLHERMGFIKVGVYKDIGFKLNRWWDVGWWQLQLQKPEVPGLLKRWDQAD